MDNYIGGLNGPLDVPEWDKIYDDAVRDNIPVIRKDTAKVLYFLLKARAPKNVLEIGTGSGYSTLWIARALGRDVGGAGLVTLERDRNRYERAVEVLKNVPGARVLYQDAFEYLGSTSETFDAVFLDSQKRDYIGLIPLLEKHMAPGALLLADNIFFNGRVLHIDPADEKKYRDGTELLKEFNQYLSSGGKFETLFLPVDDGIAAAIKK
jgi:predicted O-methyltransferase YrrM